MSFWCVIGVSRCPFVPFGVFGFGLIRQLGVQSDSADIKMGPDNISSVESSTE